VGGAGAGRSGGGFFAPDINSAWRVFKCTPGLGADAAAGVGEAKAVAAGARAAVAERAREVNAAKARVDALGVKLEQAKAGTGRHSPETAPAPPPPSAKGAKGAPAPAPAPPEKPADGGELEVLAQLGDAKAAYKAAYEAWTRSKDAALAAGAHVSTLVGRMLSEFEVRAAAVATAPRAKPSARAHALTPPPPPPPRAPPHHRRGTRQTRGASRRCCRPRKSTPRCRPRAR
jgi:hypothetical protein